MTVARMNLELAERPSARIILVRIRGESRDEAEKGRWFEQLFMRVALQEPELLRLRASGAGQSGPSVRRSPVLMDEISGSI